MNQLDSLLTLRQLRYFLSVVEHRSFSAAARALYVAQPSLSRQVAQLEQALGEPLLVRHADGVSITEAGERLYLMARQLLDRVNGAAAEIRGEARAPEGKVSLALPALAGNDTVAEVVKTCKDELPLVELKVIDGLSAHNAQLLNSGLVDFGVVPDAEQIPNLQYETLFAESLFLVRARTSQSQDPLCEVSLAEVCALPLVMGPRETHLRTFIEHVVSSHGLRLQVLYEQQSIGVIAAFVHAGLAATVSNWPAISEFFDARSVVIQRIVDPPLSRPVAIGYPAARPLNHAAQAVYAIVKRLLLARWTDGRWRGDAL